MGDFYNQVTHFIPDFACKVTHFYPNNKNYRMIFLLIPVKDLIIPKIRNYHPIHD